MGAFKIVRTCVCVFVFSKDGRTGVSRHQPFHGLVRPACHRPFLSHFLFSFPTASARTEGAHSQGRGTSSGCARLQVKEQLGDTKQKGV